jgi:hypothetical protein
MNTGLIFHWRYEQPEKYGIVDMPLPELRDDDVLVGSSSISFVAEIILTIDCFNE